MGLPWREQAPAWPRCELRAEQVDVLVLAKDYQPGEGWGCLVCGLTHLRQFAAEDPCNSLILLAGAVSDAKM